MLNATLRPTGRRSTWAPGPPGRPVSISFCGCGPPI